MSALTSRGRELKALFPTWWSARGFYKEHRLLKQHCPVWVDLLLTPGVQWCKKCTLIWSDYRRKHAQEMRLESYHGKAIPAGEVFCHHCYVCGGYDVFWDPQPETERVRPGTGQGFAGGKATSLDLCLDLESYWAHVIYNELHLFSGDLLVEWGLVGYPKQRWDWNRCEWTVEDHPLKRRPLADAFYAHTDQKVSRSTLDRIFDDEAYWNGEKRPGILRKNWEEMGVGTQEESMAVAHAQG